MNAIKSTLDTPVDPGKLEYQAYFALPEVEGLSRPWERLLSVSRCNRAFGSLEWYAASCRLNGSLSPFLVTASSGQELFGILPLALDPETGIADFPHLENDYNDMLLRDDDSSTGARLLEYAASCKKGCAQIVLSKLRPDSSCIRAAALLDHSSDIECRSCDIKSYRYAKLPASFDDYLASRSRALRKGIRRVLRDIEMAGLILGELRPDVLEPKQLPDLFLSTVLARQQQKSFFCYSNIQAFVREVLPLLFIKRSMRVFALIKNGQIIALDVAMVSANGLLTWNGGFLPEAEPWSPGSALFAFSIKEAIAAELFEYDFGEGAEAYKLSWTNGSYVVSKLQLSARSEKNAAKIWSAENGQPASPLGNQFISRG